MDHGNYGYGGGGRVGGATGQGRGGTPGGGYAEDSEDSG